MQYLLNMAGVQSGSVGDPAACRSVKTYLADVRAEQLRARITPCQAEPIILSDLIVISAYFWLFRKDAFE